MINYSLFLLLLLFPEERPSNLNLTIHLESVYKKKDAFGKGNPYLKIFIDGEENAKRVVIKNTQNPAWEESMIIFYYYYVYIFDMFTDFFLPI